LILLIDGCLPKPFFARNKDGEVIGSGSKSNWNQDSKRVLVIDNYHKKIKYNE
jgi:hypothetical protein